MGNNGDKADIYGLDMINMCRGLVQLRCDMSVYRGDVLRGSVDYGYRVGEFTTAFCLMYELADNHHNIHYIVTNKDEASAKIFGVPTLDDLERVRSDFIRMSVLARRMLMMLDDISDIDENIRDEQCVLWSGILDKMLEYALLVDKVSSFLG